MSAPGTPAFDPATYEESRKRCHARIERVLRATIDLASDPFYERYTGGSSSIVAGAVDALLLARDTVERAAIQGTLFAPSPHDATCTPGAPCGLPTCDRCNRILAHRGSRA